MKALIVAPYFYPHVGGVESYSLNIAKDLMLQGWEVVIVATGSRSRHIEVAHHDGLKIYRLRAAVRLSNTPIGFGWKRQIKHIIAEEKPDVINAHTPVPYLADITERVRGTIPFVLTYHNDIGKESFVYKCIVAIGQKLLIQKTLRGADRIIATSEYYVERSNYLKAYLYKVSIVPPGVDLTRFNRSVIPTGLPADVSEKRTVLFVGSINKSQAHKGVDILIKAFAKLPDSFNDTQLVIVGDGDAKSSYKELVMNLGIESRVIFAGFVEDKLLPQYYKKADVLVMASTDNNEGFGMVYIEANAVGTPVIGSRIGGVPYAIVDKQTGLLVKPGSVTSLKQALETVLSDRVLAGKLGDNGATRAEQQFDWKILATKTAVTFVDAMKPYVIQVAGFYPPHLGGMEVVAQQLSEGLARDGYRTWVYTSNLGSSAAVPEVIPNLNVERFSAREIAHTPLAPRFARAIFNIPRRSIMHLHLAQAFYPELVWLVSKVRHVPYVLHFHLDLQPTGALGAVFKIYKKIIIRTVIRSAAAVIVFSPDQRDFIHTTYGIDKNKISIIPNGVSDDFRAAAHHVVTSNKFVILFAGRLNGQKRVSILVDMMTHLQANAELIIVGDGEDRVALEAQVNSLNLSNVQFKGHLTPEALRSEYAQADLQVIASENEGMPLTLLEAMSAGLPVVGSDSPGIRELVSGVGLLVQEPTGQAFAAVIDPLLGNVDALNKLADQSVATASNYTWPKVVMAVENLYDKVLDEN
jgi:glycosyltransferase involved in cell wall biosynthesis